MDIGELLDIKRAMGNIGDFDGLAPQLEVRESFFSFSVRRDYLTRSPWVG